MATTNPAQATGSALHTTKPGTNPRFQITEATPNHVQSCSSIVPRAFHPTNPYIRQCFPDTPALSAWWSQIFQDEIASEISHVLIAVVNTDSPESKTIGLLAMRLLEPDDRTAGFWSRYPFTSDHNIDMFEPARAAMIEGRTKVFSGSRKRHWLIQLFGVDHGYKGLGLGKKLLEEAGRIADESQNDAFVQANASAVGIYLKHGFESLGSVIMPGELKYEEFNLVRRTQKST